MKTGCPPCGHQCEGGRDTLIRKTLHCCCQHSATAKSYMMIAFDDHSQWIWVWTNSGRQWRTGKAVCCSPKDLKELDKTERRNNSWVNKKILSISSAPYPEDEISGNWDCSLTCPWVPSSRKEGWRIITPDPWVQHPVHFGGKVREGKGSCPLPDTLLSRIKSEDGV